MTKLRATECREFIKAVVEKAEAMHVPVSIAVVGAEGHLIAVERMDLPIRVAFRDVVEIDQRQRADRVARERLGHPRPDAADPDHRDVRPLERGGRRRAIQARDAAETPRAIHVKLDFRGRGKIGRTGRGSIGGGHGSKENVSRAALYSA